MRDCDPVLPSLTVFWNRLFVVSLLGAAILLFRGSHNYCPEIQDARGNIEASHLDDGTPIISPTAGSEPALLETRRFVGERADALAESLFVSEIFRPPIAALARV